MYNFNNFGFTKDRFLEMWKTHLTNQNPVLLSFLKFSPEVKVSDSQSSSLKLSYQTKGSQFFGSFEPCSKTRDCAAAFIRVGIETISNRFPSYASVHINADGLKLDINGVARVGNFC